MSFIDMVRYRARTMLRRRTYERDVAEELRHHLDLEAMDLGSSPDGAATEARKRFGNVTYTTEERRMIAGLTVLDSARQDVSFVIRLLRRRASFAAVTIATLALGVGAATSIFSVADTVLFRPLPFPEPDRLTAVWLTRSAWKKVPAIAPRWNRGTLSWELFSHWRAAQTAFDDIAVWATQTSLVGESNAAEEMTVGHASASLLPVLAIRPERGAWFTSDDIRGGQAPVAVVSHEAWISSLGGAEDVVGRAVAIDGVRRTIIGVLPRGFSVDRGSQLVAYWIPPMEADTSGFSFQAIGRLRRGVSIAGATSEAGRILRAAATADDRIDGAAVSTLHADQTRRVRGPLLLLLAASSLLLFIACINVATLLLGESSRREQELRTRAALGAGRRRLLRQLLTESLVLAGVGALVGCGLAVAGTRLIVHAAPPSIPGLSDVRVDARVLAAALTIAVGTGLLFGIVPAWAATRGSRTVTGGGHATARGRGKGQRTLIACEVALSMVLLVAAGLLVRTFDNLSAVGFRPENLLVATVRLSRAPYEDSVHVRAVYADLVERLRRRPGVIDAAATTTSPFSGGSSSGSYQIEGVPATRDGPGRDAQRRSVTPSFFTTAGIPVIDGRGFTNEDRAGAPLVIVVSRALARREWPDGGAIGKRIKFSGAWRTIVGVAGDITTERPSADPPETIYGPLAQMMLRGVPSLIVRTTANPADAVADIRAIVNGAEAGVSVRHVDRMSDLVNAALADDRLRTVLIAIFGGIAAVLAAVGTYGVAATSASRRTREMAIRVAVGATNGSIARLIVGGAAAGVAIGAAVGVGLALGGMRVLRPYLYGVPETDPWVYAAVLVLLAASTIAATWVPARRVMRVRVVETLSAE